MIKLVHMCMGVIGIPFFIVAFSYLMKNEHLVKQSACIIQIETITKTRGNGIEDPVIGAGIEGVAFFDPGKKQGITAAHVVKNCNKEIAESQIRIHKDCFINGKKIEEVAIIGTLDLAYFKVYQGFCMDDQMLEVGGSGTKLITYDSSGLIELSLVLSGNLIDFYPNYGQSGSPIFNNNEIVGVLSKRLEDRGQIELLNN